MEKPLAAVCLGCCATMLLYGYVCEMLSLDSSASMIGIRCCTFLKGCRMSALYE